MRLPALSSLALLLALSLMTTGPARAEHRGAGFRASGTSPQFSPTLDDIYSNVLNPMCEECHNDQTALGWSATSQQTAWNTLVNQSLEFCASGTRVIPGDADNSGLIQALEATSPCLDQMPLGDPPLPQSTIDIIRAWITAGALFDTPPVPVQAVSWGRIKALYR
jgi:hypothetical protein